MLAGMQVCNALGTAWETCIGFVTPSAEFRDGLQKGKPPKGSCCGNARGINRNNEQQLGFNSERPIPRSLEVLWSITDRNVPIVVFSTNTKLGPKRRTASSFAGRAECAAKISMLSPS